MTETCAAKHCRECKHAVFSVIWGEYKCGVRRTFILHPDKEPETCKDFNESKKVGSDHG